MRNDPNFVQKDVNGVLHRKTRLEITDLATADLATGLLPGKRPCNRLLQGKAPCNKVVAGKRTLQQKLRILSLDGVSVG